MSTELSAQDAEKLFKQASNAMRADDSDKLSNLFDNESPDLEDESPIVSPDNTPEEEEEDDIVPQEDTDPAAEPVEGTEKVVQPEVTPELAQLKEQLSKLEKENHSLKSQAGRVPHVQRRLSELNKKLEELEKKPLSPSSSLPEAVKNKLKSLSETDAELADIIESTISAALSGVVQDAHSREKETLTLLRDTEHAEYEQNEVNNLLAMYPNAQEVFDSATWKDWKKGQLPGIRSLAESGSAEEVSYAFEKYSKDMVAKFPELATTAAATVQTSPVVNAEASKIEAERRRKKETQAIVGSPSATGKVKMPDDPEALFKSLSEKIRKDRLG